MVTRLISVDLIINNVFLGSRPFHYCHHSYCILIFAGYIRKLCSALLKKKQSNCLYIWSRTSLPFPMLQGLLVCKLNDQVVWVSHQPSAAGSYLSQKTSQIISPIERVHSSLPIFQARVTFQAVSFKSCEQNLEVDSKQESHSSFFCPKNKLRQLNHCRMHNAQLKTHLSKFAKAVNIFFDALFLEKCCQDENN